MGVKTLITFEQFSQLPEDENKYELDRGELITLPPNAAEHEYVKNRIARLLDRFVDSQHLPGMVYSESGFAVDPESYRIPDVAYRRTIQRGPQPLTGAPDLAIEVHSTSDSPRYISRKIAHLRETGTHTVWVVYPQFQEVHVVDPSGERWLTAADTLEAPELLPGFSLPVSKLFD